MDEKTELEMFREQKARTRVIKLASYYRHRDDILERIKVRGHEKREPLIIIKSIRNLFVEKEPGKKREPKPKPELKKRGRKPGVKCGPYKKKEHIDLI